MKQFFSIKKSINKEDMNWAQAKWKYPRLKPNRDTDRDGVKNQFDCKPFDFKRQHDNNTNSEWKRQMIEDFPTVGDLKHFAEGSKDED